MKQVCRNCIHFWADECQYFSDASIRVYAPSKSSCEHFKGNEEQVTDNTWGGARPGSGRKAIDPEEKRVQMVITIDRDTRDKLKAISKARKIRIGRLIDEMVQSEW